MSRRLKITLPDPACDHLTLIARETGESLAGVTARLVLSKIEDDGDGRLRRPLSRPTHRGRRLPTQGTTRAAVERLCERYPETLRDLPDGWWENESQLESLRALVAWRSAIDEHGCDPREELDFHSSLSECSQNLGSTVRSHAGASSRPSVIGAE